MTSLPGIDPVDEKFMRKSLDLARRGEGWVEPNPMVGCVLVRNGTTIGEGYHRRFGGPHAEIDALRSLASPADARGSTAYVSLEPCCHTGKTPPCSRALIDSGIARVVIAMPDPFPAVDGGGVQELREAGIETLVGVCREEAEQINAPYLKRVRTGKPWVIAKWAMTIDGRIATTSGESQWITGPSARYQVHLLRSRVDAIAVGMGTVEADDPMLTARLAGNPTEIPRIASRVVFCHKRCPAPDSRLIQSAGDVPLLLVTGSPRNPDIERLESLGAELIDSETADYREMVDRGLDELGRRGMSNLVVEGGGELLASFFEGNQVDECHVFLGPQVFGGRTAPAPVAGRGITKIADAWRFQLISTDRFDDDMRVIYRKA